MRVAGEDELVEQAGDDGEAEFLGHRRKAGRWAAGHRSLIRPGLAAVADPAAGWTSSGGCHRGHRALILRGGVGHDHLEPAIGAGQGDPDGFTRAILLMRFHRS